MLVEAYVTSVDLHVLTAQSLMTSVSPKASGFQISRLDDYCVNSTVPLPPTPEAISVTLALADAVVGATDTEGLRLMDPVLMLVKFASIVAGTVMVPALLAAWHSMVPSDAKLAFSALMANVTLPTVPGVQLMVKALLTEMAAGDAPSVGEMPASAVGAVTGPAKVATPAEAPTALTVSVSPSAQVSVFVVVDESAA